MRPADLGNAVDIWRARNNRRLRHPLWRGAGDFRRFATEWAYAVRIGWRNREPELRAGVSARWAISTSVA